MALNSYLPERAGSLVAAGVFPDERSAITGVRALRDIGLRRVDVTVLAHDAAAARRVASAGDAYAPKRPRLPLPRMAWFPGTIRRRYGKALDAGQIVVVAAGDGQPASTIATVLERVANAKDVTTWWQEPSSIFAPPEEGGPL